MQLIYSEAGDPSAQGPSPVQALTRAPGESLAMYSHNHLLWKNWYEEAVLTQAV